jgi:hypothetical protein
MWDSSRFGRPLVNGGVLASNGFELAVVNVVKYWRCERDGGERLDVLPLLLGPPLM